MKLLHRLSALAMTAVMAFSISGGVSAADAATATTLKIHISLLLIVQPMIMYKNYFSTAPMIKRNPTRILPCIIE